MAQMQQMMAQQAASGGGGVAGMGPPQMAGMAYGPRVISRRAPIDPNDKSAFTINIPQGAKSIIKQVGAWRSLA